MFYLDKVISQLVYPLGTSLALWVLALLLFMVGWRRLSAALSLLAVAWLSAWSLPVTSGALRLSLESQYDPLRVEELPAAAAVVVLGGGMPSIPVAWPYPDLRSGADRVWHAARLFHAGKADRVIISGGSHEWLGERLSEAEAMRVFLRGLGVPDTAILIEDRSRSTRENALYTADPGNLSDCRHRRHPGGDGLRGHAGTRSYPALAAGCAGPERKHPRAQGIPGPVDVPLARVGDGRMSRPAWRRIYLKAGAFTLVSHGLGTEAATS